MIQVYYLWWDSQFPQGAEPQYPLRSNRVGDLYWTINQSALTLTATDQPDRPTVTVDSHTIWGRSPVGDGLPRSRFP